MEAEELLKIAAEKYPVGTLYIGVNMEGIAYSEPCLANHKPILIGSGIEVGRGYVYLHGTNKWAEVIKSAISLEEYVDQLDDKIKEMEVRNEL